MRDKLLEILKLNRNNAITKEEMYKKIFHNEIDNIQLEVLEKTLKELINEKLVYCTNSNKGLYTLNPFKEGYFHIRRNGDMYVICDDNERISINSNKSDALENDKVLVRITDYNANVGTIKEVIERHGIIAEVITIKGKRFALVGKDKYEIELPNNIVDGMLIGIKIDKTKSGNFYKAKLDRILGHKNAPKLDETKILYENGAMVDFSPLTLEEVKNIQSEVYEDDLKGRTNLKNDIIFTIDGDDTKDIDDAISIEKLDNGNYKLGVHIADVSHYVKEGSNIDLDARVKGTSVYMPGVVSPMYPVELSNGICSLNPNVDRLAISCIMEFNNQGDLITYDIFKSVIKSSIQMTYKNVNKILDLNEIPKGYEPYADKLKEMKTLADILRNMRIRRGLLDFDSDEIKINVDSEGKVIDITSRTQGTGENLIEDFMLAANECVATYIFNMGLNSIYRVHDYPNEEKLIKTVNIIKSYGEKLDCKVSTKDPKVIQTILKELKTKENFDIYSNMILRCMAKACYQTSNEGHFGIGVDHRKKEAYTHFTSPIRRYPDTTIHRILTYILNNDIEHIQTDTYKANLIDIAAHSSEMEIVADNCEREANKMKMADYMSNFIGKEFKGKISGFTKNGMFVILDNYIEGRIGFNTMNDYYVYNEDLEVVIGERHKKIYRLGDKVNVIVTKSDKDTREIDFEFVKENNNHGNFKQKSKFQLFHRRKN